MIKINEDALKHYKENKKEYYFDNQEYGEEALILTNGEYALSDVDVGLWNFIVSMLFLDPKSIKRMWFFYSMTRTFRKALKEESLNK